VLRVRWLGKVRYQDALALQRALFASDGRYLLLLEHPHVYTLGVRADPAHVLVDPASVGAELVHADRGGDVTYHGPGQLVAYPIVDLSAYDNDVHAYVRGLEQVIIGALGEADVPAQTIDGLTGVWTEGDPPPTLSQTPARKIASIGLHVSRGITTHGLAINVDNDLQPFEWIVPCGIEGVEMTSLAREVESEQNPDAFSKTLVDRYMVAFNREPEAATAPRAQE